MRLLPTAVFVIPLSMVIYLAHFAGYPINHDAGILIHMAQVLVRGGIPYIDVTEIDGPMVGWVHTAPLLVSKVTSLPIPEAFLLFVTMLAAFSCWLTWKLLGVVEPPFSTDKRLVFLGVCLLGTVTLQLDLEYGQREHLFGLVLLPWTLCRLARYQGSSAPGYVTIPLAAVAGPLFLQKPYFLGVVFGIDLVMAARTRKGKPLLAPEVLILLGWGVAYFIYLVTLPSEARSDLFNRWVPYLIRHFKVYNGNMFTRDNGLTFLWIAGIMGLAFMASRRWSAERRFEIRVFVLTTALCVGAFIVQCKGYFYHHIPARLLAAGLLAFVLCRQLEDGSPTRLKRAVLGAGSILACVPVIVTLILASEYVADRRQYIHAMTTKIQQYAEPGDAVEFITTDVARNYPSAVYAQTAPGSRYHLDFVIPMAYDGAPAHPESSFPYRPTAEQTDAERQYLEELADDIARTRPKLIAIDADPECQACPPGFRIDEYLKSNGWQAKAMAQYRFVESFEQFQFYVLE